MCAFLCGHKIYYFLLVLVKTTQGGGKEMCFLSMMCNGCVFLGQSLLDWLPVQWTLLGLTPRLYPHAGKEIIIKRKNTVNRENITLEKEQLILLLRKELGVENCFEQK